MSRWIDPLAKEITEFAGHTDDCGPCANEVALATVQNREPTTAHMNAIRQRDLDVLLFRNGNGQNVMELVADVQRFEPGVHVIQYPKIVNFDNPDYNLLHQALKDIMQRHNSCVVNVGHAEMIPGNEQHVDWHFVVCGGYDDSLGYLIFNGDEKPFDGEPNWVTWDQLLAAHPAAIVEYVKQGVHPMTTPANPMQSPFLEGWHDDGTTLTAPNGIPVIEGFRAFILANPACLLWNGNVPLEKEWNDNGVSRQLFTLWGLYWDGTGVYYDHVGTQLVAARAPVAPGAQVLAPGIYQVK